MLKDKVWVKDFLSQNRTALSARHVWFREEVESHDELKGGGQASWLDMGEDQVLCVDPEGGRQLPYS